MNRKSALVLGGAGFIGAHFTQFLKNQGYWVRSVDIVPHQYENMVCDEFLLGDLKDKKLTEKVMWGPDQFSRSQAGFDIVLQLAALMGGAGFIFSGENDANVMSESALININVASIAATLKIPKLFYSSSACIYPEHNQLDPDNPNCEESSAYPANPDSEYGWEKLFSERLYMAYRRNYGVNAYVARFHNIFGPYGSWNNGKEKSPAAICRKIAEVEDGGTIEIWGDGLQTRSYLYIDECIQAVWRLMNIEGNSVTPDFYGPVNIGSDENISINGLVKLVSDIAGKTVNIKHIDGPQGVRGRVSNNTLINNKLGWAPITRLRPGLEITYNWIQEQVKINRIKDSID